MVTITTKSIRHETEHFFSRARPFEGDLAHSPIVVLLVDPEGTQVIARCIRDPELLLVLPEDTVCIQSWPGRNRSDLFTYTAGQAKPEIQRLLRERRDERGGDR